MTPTSTCCVPAKKLGLDVSGGMEWQDERSFFSDMSCHSPGDVVRDLIGWSLMILLDNISISPETIRFFLVTLSAWIMCNVFCVTSLRHAVRIFPVKTANLRHVAVCESCPSIASGLSQPTNFTNVNQRIGSTIHLYYYIYIYIYIYMYIHL